MRGWVHPQRSHVGQRKSGPKGHHFVVASDLEHESGPLGHRGTTTGGILGGHEPREIPAAPLIRRRVGYPTRGSVRRRAHGGLRPGRRARTSGDHPRDDPIDPEEPADRSRRLRLQPVPGCGDPLGAVAGGSLPELRLRCLRRGRRGRDQTACLAGRPGHCRAVPSRNRSPGGRRRLATDGAVVARRIPPTQREPVGARRSAMAAFGAHHAAFDWEAWPARPAGVA
jgi:hypothetical protein